MARLIKSEISQKITAKVTTVFESGDSTVEELKVDNVAEGLRWVENQEVLSVTGRVSSINVTISKVTPVNVLKPVDNFAKDVRLKSIIVDASDQYRSKIVTVIPSEIVEKEGVEDVVKVYATTYPIVYMTLTYSNGKVVNQTLEVGDILDNVRIMTNPGKEDITGSFVIKAFGYSIKASSSSSKRTPTIDSLYLVPKNGGTAIRAYLTKIIVFDEVPVTPVDDPGSLSGIAAALEESDEVSAVFNCDVTIPPREDGRITTVMINAGKTLDVDLNGFDLTTQAYAFYVNGGTLTINDSTGGGKIIGTRPNATYPMIQVNGGGKCIMESGIIDTRDMELEEGQSNWLYGVVCSGDGIFEMTGGQLRLGEAAAVAITNGTAAGAGSQFIIGGTSIISAENCSAVYLADNKVIMVKDKAKVYGGILAKMGDIIVKDNAYVEGCGSGKQANLGVLSVFSGCDTISPAICGITGIYKSSLGNDMTVEVSGNASLKSNDDAAVVIATVNTLYDQKCSVNIANSNRLKSGNNKECWYRYSHDELAQLAAEAGKTIAAEASTTDLTVDVDGVRVYPMLEG